MRRAWAVLPLVLLVASLSGCLAGGDLLGEPAPRFEFVASDGTYVNNTTHLGKYVVLDMMATWCGPCKLEVAHLREVQDMAGDRVVIYSIGVDRGESMADLEAFGEEHGARWPYAIDRNGSMWRSMEGEIIPKLVVLDPQGVVVLERQGEVLPAAIIRVVDPSLAPSPLLPLATGLAGVALGFLAAFNPYRRVHRDGEGGGPTLAALGILAVLGMLAWSFAGLFSTRATLGSLFIGALTLGAAVWWIRVRRKPVPHHSKNAPWQRASDRAYEIAPHYAMALVLALLAIGATAFFAPILGFLLGATGGFLTRPRVPAPAHEPLGVGGLLFAGLGLLLFGARFFAV